MLTSGHYGRRTPSIVIAHLWSSSHGELLALSDALPLFTSQRREIYWIIDSECVLQTIYNLSTLPLNKALKSPLAIPLAYLLMTSSSSSPCTIHFLKQESHIASPMNAVADAMAGEARRNPSTQPHLLTPHPLLPSQL